MSEVLGQLFITYQSGTASCFLASCFALIDR